MDAEVIQLFPEKKPPEKPKPSTALAAKDYDPMLMEQGGRLYKKAVEDAIAFLKVQNADWFSKLTSEERLFAVTHIADLILSHAKKQASDNLGKTSVPFPPTKQEDTS